MPWWVGTIAVLTALGAALGLVRLYQRRFSPPPETPRKIVHVVMGLVAVTFPWVFSERWPVVLLGVLATLAMLAVRLLRPLRSGVGNVLHSVDRESLGEVCFPVSITVVWWLSFGDPLLYVVPVLLLTFADAVAAIVGLRYGHRQYSTAEAPKTVEGSAAFFIVSFASVFVPYHFFSDAPTVVVLLVALLLSMLVVMFEAIAWRGLDNLFVPLGGYVFLNAQIDESPAWLLLQVVVLLALAVLGIWYRQRTTLTDNGVLAVTLTGYTFWVLGGWQWLIAPITFFLAYAVIAVPLKTRRGRIHDTRAVMGYSAAGLWWVFLAYSTGHPELLYAFTASLAAGLAMFGADRLRKAKSGARTLNLGLLVVADWALMFVPWMVIVGVSPASIALAGVGFVATGVGVATILLTENLFAREMSYPMRWFAQAVIAFTVSLGAALMTGMVTL